MEEKFQAVWFDRNKYGKELTVDNFKKIYQDYLEILGIISENNLKLDEKYSEQDLKTFSEEFYYNLMEKLYFSGTKKLETVEEALEIYSKSLEEFAKFKDELKNI